MDNSNTIVENIFKQYNLLQVTERKRNEKIDIYKDLIREKDPEIWSAPYFQPAMEDPDIIFNIENEYTPSIEKHTKNITQLLDKLYTSSKNDNYFYFDCPVEVYKNGFENKLAKYTTKYKHCSKKDFYLSEIDVFADQQMNRVLYYKEDTFNYSNYINHKGTYSNNLSKKINFLKSKVKPFKINIKFFENEIIHNDIGDIIGHKSVIEVLGYDEQLTANRAVLLLGKLGFLSNELFNNLPNTKQSAIISLLTGLNSKNIKTAIENLEKKPSQLSKRYSEDISFIDNLLKED